MKKTVVFIISLLILTSFLISCDENANVDGFIEGNFISEAFTKVYLNYYYLDPNDPDGFSNTRFGRATSQWNDLNEFLITTTRDKKQNIKGYGKIVEFATVADLFGNGRGYFDESVGEYYFVNNNSLNEFVEHGIYGDYFGEDRDELIATAQERLRAWLGTINTNPKPNECIEPVFAFADDAVFTDDPREQYLVISPLFYMPCLIQNNGSTVIMNKSLLPLYNYDDVLAEPNPRQFTQVDIFMTVIIMKNIPDY